MLAGMSHGFSVTLVQQKRTWNSKSSFLRRGCLNGLVRILFGHPMDLTSFIRSWLGEDNWNCYRRGGWLDEMKLWRRPLGILFQFWLVVDMMFRCCNWIVWRLLLQIQVITSLQVLLRLCEHFVSASCGLHASGLSFQQGPESKCTDISKIRGYRWRTQTNTYRYTFPSRVIQAQTNVSGVLW